MAMCRKKEDLVIIGLCMVLDRQKGFCLIGLRRYQEDDT
jgi:hypothetical protein